MLINRQIYNHIFLINELVENSLIKLCAKHLKEKDETANVIYIDKNTTNIDLVNLIFNIK